MDCCSLRVVHLRIHTLYIPLTLVFHLRTIMIRNVLSIHPNVGLKVWYCLPMGNFQCLKCIKINVTGFEILSGRENFCDGYQSNAEKQWVDPKRLLCGEVWWWHTILYAGRMIRHAAEFHKNPLIIDYRLFFLFHLGNGLLLAQHP